MKLGMEVVLGPGHIVLDGDPAPPPSKGHSPNFRPMSVVPLGREVGLGPGNIVLGGHPTLSPKKGHNSPHFSAHVYCGQTVAHLSYC